MSGPRNQIPRRVLPSRSSASTSLFPEAETAAHPHALPSASAARRDLLYSSHNPPTNCRASLSLEHERSALRRVAAPPPPPARRTAHSSNSKAHSPQSVAHRSWTCSTSTRASGSSLRAPAYRDSSTSRAPPNVVPTKHSPVPQPQICNAAPRPAARSLARLSSSSYAVSSLDPPLSPSRPPHSYPYLPTAPPPPPALPLRTHRRPIH